ncbi:MAG: hypothetical protein ACYSX0_22505, partial [Planctomycetota bacterium]
MLRRRFVCAALAVLALILCAGFALAKGGKPPKPPPEPPLDSGTIYFLPGLTYTIHQMDPDGTNVTALSS